MLMTAFAAASMTPGRAAPLDPSVCEQLQTRLDELRKDGVEADMAMGPEAARTRLPIDRFNRIGTYIQLDEQLNFRCGLAKQRIVLPTTVEGGEEEVPAAGDAPAPGAAPVAAAKAPLVAKQAGAASDEPPAKRKEPAKKQSKAAKSPDAADGEEKPAPKTVKKATPKAAKKATAKSGEDPTGQANPAEAPAKKSPPKKAAPPKQPAAKVDDAYRPPPKAAAREPAGAGKQ